MLSNNDWKKLAGDDAAAAVDIMVGDEIGIIVLPLFRERRCERLALLLLLMGLSEREFFVLVVSVCLAACKASIQVVLIVGRTNGGFQKSRGWRDSGGGGIFFLSIFSFRSTMLSYLAILWDLFQMEGRCFWNLWSLSFFENFLGFGSSEAKIF